MKPNENEEKTAADRNEEFEARLKGRTPEQKKVIRYFLKPDGFLSFKISDYEYDELVVNKYLELDLYKKALDKIGKDESEVNEIKAIVFKDWHYEKGNDKIRVKKGKDGKLRSSAYQVSWLFFSDTQIYTYKYTFHMDSNNTSETTQEYFWQDITNFTTSTESVETERKDSIKFLFRRPELIFRRNIDTYHVFRLIVPGDEFKCTLENDEISEKKIKAMKFKLREKKEQFFNKN